jgi:LacI family transcriptional regulator
MKMSKRKVTAKDVAACAGVSETTVSMILNGKGEHKFPEKTCRKVLIACEKLGYLHKIRTHEEIDKKLIAAITPTMANMYYVQMLEEMQNRASELGYSLLSFNTFRKTSQEIQILDMCSQLPIAGLLFLYPPENKTLFQQFNWTKPIIRINDKNIGNDSDVFELDGFQIGRIIGEYLFKLAHKRVALVSSTFDTNQVTRIRRLEGIRAVYQEHGCDPEGSVLACSPEQELKHLKEIPKEYDLGYLIAKGLLERHEAVTAFVGVNDMIAIGIMDAILDAGYRIPEDYSVCGCDNTCVTKYRGISLTSVESYSKLTGREAVDMLVRKIDGDRGDLKPEENPNGITKIEYFPRLIIRKTTGPCPK